MNDESSTSRAAPVKKTVLALCVLGVVVYGLWYSGRMDTGMKMKRVEADFNAILYGLKKFETDMGALPATEEGLRALVDQPPAGTAGRRWTQLMDRVPLDPWGNEYRYTMIVVGGKPRITLRSAGPDGRDGTRDDQEKVAGG